jgi:uncharacterized coiled-coil protein SlyX
MVQSMDEETLLNMQSMLAHQERQIQDLSDMLNLHRKEIDILKLRLEKTQAKLLEVQSDRDSGTDESLSVTEQALRDKPPHY